MKYAELQSMDSEIVCAPHGSYIRTPWYLTTQSQHTAYSRHYGKFLRENKFRFLATNFNPSQSSNILIQILWV
jgi:hypothetical protein